MKNKKRNIGGPDVAKINIMSGVVPDDSADLTRTVPPEDAANSINEPLLQEGVVAFGPTSTQDIDSAGYIINPPTSDPQVCETGIGKFLDMNSTPADVEEFSADGDPVSSGANTAAGAGSFTPSGVLASFRQRNASFRKWSKLFLNAGIIYVPAAENIVFVNSKMYDPTYVPVSSDYVDSLGTPLYDEYVETMTRGDYKRVGKVQRKIAKLAYAISQAVQAQTNDTNPFYTMTIGEIYDRLQDYFVRISRMVVSAKNMRTAIAMRKEIQGGDFAYYTHVYQRLYTASRVYDLEMALAKLEAQLAGEFYEPGILSDYLKIGSIGYGPAQVGCKRFIIPMVSKLNASETVIGFHAIPGQNESSLENDLDDAAIEGYFQWLLNYLNDSVAALLGATISITRVALNAFNGLPRLTGMRYTGIPVQSYIPKWLLCHQDCAFGSTQSTRIKFFSGGVLEYPKFIANAEMRVSLDHSGDIPVLSPSGSMFSCIINNRGDGYLSGASVGKHGENDPNKCTVVDPNIKLTRFRYYSRKTAGTNLGLLEGAGFESLPDSGLCPERGLYPLHAPLGASYGDGLEQKDDYVGASSMRVFTMVAVQTDYAMLARGFFHNPGMALAGNHNVIPNNVETDLAAELTALMTATNPFPTDVSDQVVAAWKNGITGSTLGIGLNGIAALDEALLPAPHNVMFMASHHVSDVNTEIVAWPKRFTLTDAFYGMGRSAISIALLYTGVISNIYCTVIVNNTPIPIPHVRVESSSMSLNAESTENPPAQVTLTDGLCCMPTCDLSPLPDVWCNSGMAHKQQSMALEHMNN